MQPDGVAIVHLATITWPVAVAIIKLMNVKIIHYFKPLQILAYRFWVSLIILLWYYSVLAFLHYCRPNYELRAESRAVSNNQLNILQYKCAPYMYLPVLFHRKDWPEISASSRVFSSEWCFISLGFKYKAWFSTWRPSVWVLRVRLGCAGSSAVLCCALTWRSGLCRDN